jgi:hypothetical protein
MAADTRVHQAGAGRGAGQGRRGRRHPGPGPRGGGPLQGKARRIDNIASIKAWAGLVGMSGGPVRPPLISLAAGEQAALAADLAAVGLLA